MAGLVRAVVTVVAIAVLFRLLERRGVRSHGAFLGIPYDFRFPTPARLKESFWNPRDSRVLTPHVFGWGYSVNIPALLRWLRPFR